MICNMLRRVTLGLLRRTVSGTLVLRRVTAETTKNAVVARFSLIS
jgi:hypothetical protein